MGGVSDRHVECKRTFCSHSLESPGEPTAADPSGRPALALCGLKPGASRRWLASVREPDYRAPPEAGRTFWTEPSQGFLTSPGAARTKPLRFRATYISMCSKGPQG